MAFLSKALDSFQSLRYPLSTFFGWMSAVLGAIGGLGVLIAAFANNATVKDFVLSFALAAIALILLCALIQRESTLAPRAYLARTLPLQERAHAIVGDLVQLLGSRSFDPDRRNIQLGMARKKLEEVLTIYADIFSALTNTRCRTCIKLIEVDAAGVLGQPQGIHIFTLARDARSAAENKVDDRKRAEAKHDKLTENSDFVQLWNPEVDDDGYYICNDLSAEADYQSTSLSWKAVPHRARQTGWSLWYRATIVWPIRRMPMEELAIDQPTCIGFLTVDSGSSGVFIADDHPLLGKILAGALFPVLESYLTLSQRTS